MRLLKVQKRFEGRLDCKVNCKQCNAAHYLNTADVYADLDGTPFQSYYCKDCVLGRWTIARSGGYRPATDLTQHVVTLKGGEFVKGI